MGILRKAKRQVLTALQVRGRTLERYPISEFLQRHEIGCVLDVGANVGQYGMHLRELGYTGRIVSFEPLPSALVQLKRIASCDANWQVEGYALGASQSVESINLAVSSAASSFLKIEAGAAEAAPQLTATSSINVEVKPLATVVESLDLGDTPTFLKIDAQGYELPVLLGVGDELSRFSGVQLEVSLNRVYQDEPLIEDVILWMRDRDFSPFWMQQGYRLDEPLKLMQVDLIFSRT